MVLDQKNYSPIVMHDKRSEVDPPPAPPGGVSDLLRRRGLLATEDEERSSLHIFVENADANDENF